jgi:hypothetical protein
MAKGGVAHNRKIKTAEELKRLWEEYKVECDNHIVLTHEFSQKLGDFVSRELPRRISYTVEGFCVFINISRHAFYENYAGKEPWATVAAHIKEECEIDARRKFETGQIPPQLAALWMSKYGYGVIKAETEAANLVDEWVKGVLNDDS